MKRIGILALFGAVLALLSIPLISANWQAQWHVDFYSESGFGGDVARMSYDGADLALDWGEGAPLEDFPVDNFSAKVTRIIEVDSPTRVMLMVSADSSPTTYINGNLISDNYADLDTGMHVLYIEYEHGEGAGFLNAGYELTDDAVENLIPAISDETSDDDEEDMDSENDDMPEETPDGDDESEDIDEDEMSDDDGDEESADTPTQLILDELFEDESFGEGETLSYILTFEEGTLPLVVIIADTASDLRADISYTNGNTLGTQDEAFAGGYEIFLLPDDTAFGDVIITVSEVTGTAADYEIGVMDLADFTFDADVVSTEALPTDTEIVWNYTLTTQDLLFVRATPSSDEDLVISIYDSEDNLIGRSDDTLIGAELMFFNPMDDGDYVIGIYDYFGNEGAFDAEIGFVNFPEDESDDEESADNEESDEGMTDDDESDSDDMDESGDDDSETEETVIEPEAPEFNVAMFEVMPADGSDTVSEGGQVIVRWDVPNATNVHIKTYVPEIRTERPETLVYGPTSSGEITYTLDASNNSGSSRFELSATNETETINETVRITVNCTFGWFFAEDNSPLFGCPYDEAQAFTLLAQEFELGWLIVPPTLIGSPGVILISKVGDPPQFISRDGLNLPVDESQTESLGEVTEGLFYPTGAFANIYFSDGDIQDSLGFAITEEPTMTETFVQTTGLVDTFYVFFGDADGAVWQYNQRANRFSQFAE